MYFNFNANRVGVALNRPGQSITVTAAGAAFGDAQPTILTSFVRRTGFKAHRTHGDVFAAKITELSGDCVTLDDTEEVLVALRRKKVIAGRRLVDLLGRHRRESRE